MSAQDLFQENESEASENQRAQGENVPAGGADVSEEELRMALEKGQPEKYLSGRITETEIARRGMPQILDAESFREKRQLLVGLRPYIDKLLLHNIAAALDVVLEEGTLDDQFESLLHCVDAMPDMKEGDCGHDQENYTQYDTGVCQDKTFFMGNDFAGDSVCCIVYRSMDTAASDICTGSACIVDRCLCDCKFCYDQYAEDSKIK